MFPEGAGPSQSFARQQRDYISDLCLVGTKVVDQNFKMNSALVKKPSAGLGLPS